jgi:hypothetical protein
MRLAHRQGVRIDDAEPFGDDHHCRCPLRYLIGRPRLTKTVSGEPAEGGGAGTGRPLRRPVHGDILGGDATQLGGGARGASRENVAFAMKFFEDRGLSHLQAAAFVGRLIAESSLNPAVRDPTGHVGVAQWDRSRATALFGSPEGARNASLEDQLKGIWKEWQGPEARSFERLKKAATLREGLGAAEAFERAGLPRFGERAAQDILGNYGPQVAPSNVTHEGHRTGTLNAVNNFNTNGSDVDSGHLQGLIARSNGVWFGALKNRPLVSS